MAARRQVTNKLRGQYRKASKAGKGEILDRVVTLTGMGRSTARRMLGGPQLPDPATGVDGRTLRARGFSDDARALLEKEQAERTEKLSDPALFESDEGAALSREFARAQAELEVAMETWTEVQEELEEAQASFEN